MAQTTVVTPEKPNEYDWDEAKPQDTRVEILIDGFRAEWELTRSEHPALLRGLFAVFLVKLIEIGRDYSYKMIGDGLQFAIEQKNFLPVVFPLAITFAAIPIRSAANNWGAVLTYFRAVYRLEAKWPGDAFKKLLGLSASFHEQNSMGRNVTKVIKGCSSAVNMAGGGFFNNFPQIIHWALSFSLLLTIDWRISFTLILPIFPALWLNARMLRRFAEPWNHWDSLAERANSRLYGVISAIPTVRAFAQEEEELRTQTKLRRQMCRLDTAIIRSERVYYYFMSVLMDLGFYLSVVLAIYLAIYRDGTLGTILFLLMTGRTVVQSFWDVMNCYRDQVRQSVPILRMHRLMQEKNSMPMNPKAIIPPTSSGTLEFHHASFHYEGKTISAVQDLCLQITPGTMTAFVGHTGSGKSTTIGLLLRNYDPQTGSLRFDGRDIREIQIPWYRRLFAVVSQNIDVFDETLRKNVCYGHPNASDAEVLAALKASRLDISLFPKGLQTMVGERGIRLSGGERQRLGIARALLHIRRGASILILDEATSSLDSLTERAIQEMLERLRIERPELTIIAVAHRLSTIQRADRIHVFDAGHIVEQGTHDELVAAQGHYAKLVQLQNISNESLKNAKSLASFYFSGTGSSPPGCQGVHRVMRRIPSQDPRINPYLPIA